MGQIENAGQSRKEQKYTIPDVNGRNPAIAGFTYICEGNWFRLFGAGFVQQVLFIFHEHCLSFISHLP